MLPFSALLAARVTRSQHRQLYGIADTDGGACHGSNLDPRIASHAAATCRSFLQRHVLCRRRSCKSYSNTTVASNTINKAI